VRLQARPAVVVGVLPPD
jgi:hypothetical protein